MADLFYDDEYQALRRTIEDGRGYKATALHLWPGMKPDSAYARLKVCCNPSGDQHLRFREYVAVMVFNERFDVLYHLCDETAHDRPRLRSPADHAADLQRTVAGKVDELRGLIERLERLSRPPLQTVMRGSGGSGQA